MTNNKEPNKILVLTKVAYFDIDKLVAAIVLAKILGRQRDSAADIYTFRDIPLKDLSRVVAPEKVKFVQKLEADYFTVSIPKGDAKIKEVKWEEDKDKLNLLVFTETGQLSSPEYTLHPGKADYSQIITFGIKTQEEIEKPLSQLPLNWQHRLALNIDLRPENKKYATENFIYPDVTSYAETVMSFVEQKELAITNNEATELLAAIYWKTNSLRNRYTTQTTFSNIQKLLQLGATLTQSTDRIFASTGLVELKARQEIYHSLRLTVAKVAFASITPETAKMLTTICPINPSKNPLYNLKDIDASFIFLPINPDKTMVLASSRAEKINLKKVLGAYKYVGDPLQAELTFPANIEQTERIIMSALRGIHKEEKQKPPVEKKHKETNMPKPEPVIHKTKPTKPQPNTPQAAEPLPAAATPVAPRAANGTATSFAPEPPAFGLPEPTPAADPLPSAAK